MKQTEKIIMQVMSHTVLGVKVFRGYARLCDLARMSKADVYDQKRNPSGTQRDLSPKHAREAYLYVSNETIAFWPEIFLCVRDKSVIRFLPRTGEGRFGRLEVNIRKISASKQVLISRVDGNHRLHYAAGDHDGYDAVEKYVSFCIAYDLKPENEIKLFRDINNNQRRMNTSHLDNIDVRLSSDALLKKRQPDLFIAKSLASDKASPFQGLVHDGGAKKTSTPVPLRTLRTGIRYMLSKSARLPTLEDADAQYKVIRNYFLATKRWIPKGWSDFRDHLTLRGAGLWGLCFIGAEVIDRALGKGEFQVDKMLKILRSGKEWDWSTGGEFRGLSGRGGAVEIQRKVVSEFADDSGITAKDLFKKIMEE